MNKVDTAEKNVLDGLQREESRLSWEDRISLMESLKEFIDEHLEELRNESHA